MSWKLFFQIVLLIIIAVVVMSVVKPLVKCGMYRCGYMDKMHHMQQSQ
jgi:hypothetical protein